MKKIFAIFGAATMLFACTKEMNDAPSFADGNGLKFKASIEAPTKVATTQGKSAWEAGDDILLYSAAAGADEGPGSQHSAVGTGSLQRRFVSEIPPGRRIPPAAGDSGPYGADSDAARRNQCSVSGVFAVAG